MKYTPCGHTLPIDQNTVFNVLFNIILGLVVSFVIPLGVNYLVFGRSVEWTHAAANAAKEFSGAIGPVVSALP